MNLSSDQPRDGLQPKHLDLHVIVIPIAMMDEMFGVVLPPVTDLAKMLSSVHVTGPWDNPAIAKETINNLQESTIEFLRKTIHRRGKLSPNVTDAVDTILDILQEIGKSQDK